MITIIGRRLVIPDCDRVLGASGDSGTKLRVRLSEDTVKRYFPDGATVDNVGITLVMEYKNGGSAFPSVALTYAKDGVHEGYVTIADSRASGLLVSRALLTYVVDGKNVAMQTEEDYFLVSDDIEASDVTDTGNTYTAWNAVLTDIKAETSKITATEESLEETVEVVGGYASSAEESAKNANNAYQDSKGLKDSLEGVLTMAYESATNAYNSENGAVAARNAAETYSETAMGHSASAQYYSEESMKYSKDANDYKNEARGAVTDAEGIKAQVETLKADVIKESENVAKRVTEAVSAKVDAVNAKGESERIKVQVEEYVTDARGYANEALTARDTAVSAKDATLRVVGDIESAIDAIIEIQDSLIDGVATLPGEEDPEPLE